MPELPEVEVVRRGLIAPLKGQKIATCTVYRPDLRYPVPPTLAQDIIGTRVIEIGRRAKYLQLFLDQGLVWCIHLGMSGRILMSPILQGAPPSQRHDHVVWTVAAAEGGGHHFSFRDPRRFGFMALIPAPQLPIHPFFRHLGPEPFEEAFSLERLAQTLQKSRRPIKIALMDQRLVVGVGNIYASEALFNAQIHPARLASSLTFPETEKLHGAIIDILRQAIEAGGSTLRDYRHPSGEIGDFQSHFRVYDQAQKPCSRCHKGPIEKQVQGGRATYYCPSCQI